MDNLITYIENENGLLIPQIEMPNLSNIGKYGAIFKNYLKYNNVLIYSRLIRKGELQTFLKNLNTIATDRIINMVEDLFLKSDYANSSDTMLIYQEKERLKMSAEEIVISDIISQL